MADVPASISDLLIRHAGGAWSAPEATGYALEADLQELLYTHPTLIPGVSAPYVACREFQTGPGPADVLVITGSGQLVVVECKLAYQADVRRSVVGQVLDYASNLWQMPIGDFERQWRSRTGTSPFESFDVDAAVVRERVETALAEGRFTLILAVDGINPSLRRIVEFLNRVTRPEMSIMALEAARVVDGDVEVLVPRVYGAEIASSISRDPEGVQQSTDTWTEADLRDWLSENRPDLIEPVESFLRGAETATWEIGGARGKTPALMLIKRGFGVWPISLYSGPGGGRIQVRLYAIQDTYPEPLRFLEALAHVPGTDIDLEVPNFRRRIEVPFDVLLDSTAREALVKAVAVLATYMPTAEGSLEPD
jgi:hypothetical protein